MNNIAKHYITYSEKVQGKSIAELSEILPEYLAPDIEWKCSHPFNEINGLTATIKNFWQPFVHAFPDWQRRIEILFHKVLSMVIGLFPVVILWLPLRKTF